MDILQSSRNVTIMKAYFKILTIVIWAPVCYVKGKKTGEGEGLGRQSGSDSYNVRPKLNKSGGLRHSLSPLWDRSLGVNGPIQT